MYNYLILIVQLLKPNYKIYEEQAMYNVPKHYIQFWFRKQKLWNIVLITNSNQTLRNLTVLAKESNA